MYSRSHLIAPINERYIERMIEVPQVEVALRATPVHITRQGPFLLQ